MRPKEQRLRIAFDATAIPDNRAGAGTYIVSLVQALSRTDRDNEYVVFVKPKHLFEFGALGPNFRLISVPLSSTLRRLVWEQTALPSAVRRLRADVLHSPHYTMPLLPGHGCRPVVTFHDMTYLLMPALHPRFHHLFFSAMMRFSVRCAARLLVVSESTRRDLHRLLPASKGKTTATPLAAGPVFRPVPAAEIQEVCTRYTLTPGRFLLYVGVLEPRKNVPMLLQAFARIAAQFPDTPLVLVGKKGWMYEAIFAELTTQGLAGRVVFTGYVPQEDLPPLYGGARVFVYPSLYEGFGLPVLEAMQCGAPVVTTDISSMPEVVGDAALLVKPDDADALTAALTRVLSDDALAADLRQRGLARAALFSWDRCARETRAVYEEMGKIAMSTMPGLRLSSTRQERITEEEAR